MQDKTYLIYGHLCMTGPDAGFLDFDGSRWNFNNEEWKRHCAGIANAGANAVQILPYSVWGPRPYGRKSQWSPWLLGDGNLWDLSKWSNEYFQTMRRIFEIANSFGLTAWFPWFDHCQLHPGTWAGMSPWKNNTQGIRSPYDPNADDYTRGWIKQVIFAFSDLDMFWPLGNENNNPAFPPFVKRVIFPIIKSLRLDFNRMTYGATMGEAAYLGNGKYAEESDHNEQGVLKKWVGAEFGDEAKLNIYREVHGCGGPCKPEDHKRPFGHRFDQALYWWGKNPIRKVFSDDGVHNSGNVLDGGRPTAETWRAMMNYALSKYPHSLGGRDYLLNFAHCPEGGDLEYQITVVRAMSEAYNTQFGHYPANYGKHAYVPPEPPKPPEPPTPKKCKCSYWLTEPRRPDIRRWIKCLFGGKKRCK